MGADRPARWCGPPRSAAEPSRFVERTAECCRLLAPKVDLDLIAYTPEGFEQMRERPFVAQVLREGRVLHETAA